MGSAGQGQSVPIVSMARFLTPHTIINDISLSLEDCLSFFSGANSIPAAGFHDICTLNFSPTNVYPTASTCALVVTLPSMHHWKYSVFREKMLYAFVNHGGFGLC